MPSRDFYRPENADGGTGLLKGRTLDDRAVIAFTPPQCHRGHRLVPSNVYRDTRGVNRCRTCRRLNEPLKERTCKQCSGPFTSTTRAAKYCTVCRPPIAAERAARARKRNGSVQTKVCAYCHERQSLVEFRLPGPAVKGEHQYADACHACTGNDDEPLPVDSPHERALRETERMTGLDAAEWYNREHPASMYFYARMTKHAGLLGSGGWGDEELALRVLLNEGYELHLCEIGHREPREARVA